MNRADHNPGHPIEERARELFSESVAGLDGQTRSQLRQARARAVAAAGSRGRGFRSDPFRLVPAGGIAAVLLALLIFRGGFGPVIEPAATAALDDFDLLLDGQALELFEDLEFYAWLLGQPGILEDVAADDGSG